ncbi:hypothetical protein QEN19_000603 [Hanseniaspora menglaensis]
MSAQEQLKTPIVEEIFEDGLQKRQNDQVSHPDALVVDNGSFSKPSLYKFMNEHPEVVVVVMDENENSAQPQQFSTNGGNSYTYSSKTSSSSFGYGQPSSSSYQFSSSSMSSNINGTQSFFSSSSHFSSIGNDMLGSKTFFDSRDGKEIHDSYYNAGHGTYKIEFPVEEKREKSNYSFLNNTDVIDMDEVVDLTSETELSDCDDDDVIMID